LWICSRSDSVRAGLRNSENLSWKVLKKSLNWQKTKRGGTLISIQLQYVACAVCSAVFVTTCRALYNVFCCWYYQGTLSRPEWEATSKSLLVSHSYHSLLHKTVVPEAIHLLIVANCHFVSHSFVICVHIMVVGRFHIFSSRI